LQPKGNISGRGEGIANRGGGCGKILARKINAKRAAISNTCWMGTQIFKQIQIQIYTYIREESKNANTRPAEIKIKNTKIVRLKINVDGKIERKKITQKKEEKTKRYVKDKQIFKAGSVSIRQILRYYLAICKREGSRY